MSATRLTRYDQGRWWTWSAIEVVAAHDLTRVTEYVRLEASKRLELAARRQAAFLERLLALETGEVVALRYLAPGDGALRVYLLVRVWALTHEAAEERSAVVTRQLAMAAPHVETSEDVPAGPALAPFTVPSDGFVQITKRVRRQAPIRPDAHVSEYVAVEPMSSVVEDWGPLLQAMIDSSDPVCLTVGMTPTRVSAELRQTLEREVARYARLKQASEVPSETGGRMILPADGSAAILEPIYADALMRYADVAFKFAVTLASSARVDPMLAETVGRTLSSVRSGVGGRRDAEAVSAGYSLRWPHSQQEFERLQSSFVGLEPLTLDNPDLLGPLEADRDDRRQCLRVLHGLVDRAEALSIFRLPAAIEGPLPGLPVRTPPDAIRTFRASSGGPAIEIGAQGGGASLPVELPLTDLARHAFIVGTPGSGKTNAALHLCRQLSQHHVPFLVIEPVNSELNDYRWLATQPGLEDLLVFTVGNESVAPLRLNPFEVPTGATVSAHVSNLLACFEAAFGLWDPLPFIYRRALVRTYRTRGFHADRRGAPELAGRWPVLADFVGNLTAVTAELGYTGEIGYNIDAAARLRAEALAEGACGTTLDTRQSFPIDVLLRRPVVLELAGVGDNAKEQALMTLLLLTAIRGARRAAPRSGLHVVLLEEAHRIFPRAAPSTGGGDTKEGNAQALAAERIAQGLAEDRKYGQSYVLIDQQVGKVAEDAYKITNLKVMHRTSAAQDRELLGSTMSLTPDQIQSAAALAPFQAVVSHNRLDSAVTVRVPDVRAADAARRGLEEAPLANDDQLRETFLRLVSEPDFADAMAPFEECHACCSRCMFRRYSESVMADEALALEVLDMVGTEGWPGVSRRLQAAVDGGGEQVVEPAALDLRVCLVIHALRRVHPPSRWDAEGHEDAIEWADVARRELEVP